MQRTVTNSTPWIVSNARMRSRRALLFPLLALGSAVLVTGCASAPKPAEVPSTPVQMAPPEPVAPAPTDGMTPAFTEAFAAADLRARSIAFYQQCVPTVARLRAAGRFGAAARAPRAIFCERDAEGVPIGGVFDVDSAFKAPRGLTAVRLDGDRPKYTGILDTAAIVSRAKLARDVNKVVTPVWAKLKRPFTVVPVTVASGTHEAWVIPRATRAGFFVMGGDAAYVSAATGVSQTVDHTKTWMQIALPARGQVRITSAEPSVAAVTDLASARYYTELGRDVTVTTAAATSTLVPGLDPTTGARVVWKHQPIR
ncbi:hypothetical protein GAU_3884 [Gemmatimonas aurantiaca T-27]|uniref:Uncharacterized protein n=1 Tax=Gemmatimonas aurantiaca (strain DSM 14586 / JCM 11422 / NBRC 100505 / T-27) TaxID=379066 RepID=C1AEJ9_GEMAT|nr:hypothetical protein GAU_3884 [Gemmatimonas aurantiaca T-27]